MSTYLYHFEIVLIGSAMDGYVTVSIKIPQDVKEELEKHGVKISEILRNAIEEEYRKVVIGEIKREIEQLAFVFRRFSRDFIIESLREDRER